MNSTIKQFAELSKTYKTIVVDGQMQSVLLIDPEKFAKMIVLECVEVADHSNVNGKSIIGERIKEHFGIKI